MARVCEAEGADGLSLVNAVQAFDVDVERRRPVLRSPTGLGGLSGPAIKPIALLKVHQVRQVAAPHGVQIIGQGGVVSAVDAAEFAIAGADAIGVGTGLFYEPLLCGQLNAGLAAYLRDQGQADFAGLVGSLRVAD